MGWVRNWTQRPRSGVAQTPQKTMWAHWCGLSFTFKEVSQAGKECPARCADQQTTKRGLEHLSAAYGQSRVTESDQSTRFIGHVLQGWVQQLGVKWMWPWTFQHMDQRWLALLAPWGKGLEAGLLCIPVITANWPPTITVLCFYGLCVLDASPGCSCRVMAGMDELWT